MIKKRAVSLLEVLIAMLLISIALPLLISPFLYTAQDRLEERDKLRLEKAAHFALSYLLIDLQTGSVPLTNLDTHQQYPLPETWLKDLEFGKQVVGAYQFNRLKPAKTEEKQNLELWQASIQIRTSAQKQLNEFKYEFVVVNPPEQATP